MTEKIIYTIVLLLGIMILLTILSVIMYIIASIIKIIVNIVGAAFYMLRLLITTYIIFPFGFIYIWVIKYHVPLKNINIRTIFFMEGFVMFLLLGLGCLLIFAIIKNQIYKLVYRQNLI